MRDRKGRDVAWESLLALFPNAQLPPAAAVEGRVGKGADVVKGTGRACRGEGADAPEPAIRLAIVLAAAVAWQGLPGNDAEVFPGLERKPLDAGNS